MNLKQLAKLMAGGLLAMAAVPAISLARTHHHVSAIAPSLSATTTTPLSSTAKHTRVALVSHKHNSLSARTKSARALSHRTAAHTSLTHRGVRHSALSRHTSSHIALSSLSHKTTKLSSRKKSL